MALADTIRTQRRAQGLTQGQLALALERKRTTIAKYESGAITPPLVIVRRMTRIFHCSMHELLADETEDAVCATPTAPSSAPQP